MTQGDIENGGLLWVVGVTRDKPAKFVIFRIEQTG
jgi:phage tail sheath protein FI